MSEKKYEMATTAPKSVAATKLNASKPASDKKDTDANTATNTVSTNPPESNSNGAKTGVAPASTAEPSSKNSSNSDVVEDEDTRKDNSEVEATPPGTTQSCDDKINEEEEVNDSTSEETSGQMPVSNDFISYESSELNSQSGEDITNWRVRAATSKQYAKQEFVLLKSYAFNQNGSGFICTTTKGIRVYTCEPLFEFTRHEYPDWQIGACVIGQMLYKTNCFIVVSADDKKKVKIWNEQSKAIVGELRSRVDVLHVSIARYILAMVTEYANQVIYVYKCECLSPLQVIPTGRNPCGLCSIANIDTRIEWKIACPATVTGAVRIQTSEGGRSNHVFTAHKAPLFNLSFNYDGRMLATASIKGTVVRVFSVFEGNLLYEFRRGTPSSMISCITFRRDDMFLATASSTSTVHIFKLCSTRKNTNDGFAQLFGNDTAGESDDTATVENHVVRRNILSEGTSHGVSDQKEGNISATNENSASLGIASAIYDTSVGVVQDTLKGVLPSYFKPDRSFAQFHIPKDNLTIDVSDNSSNIIGPLCAFVHDDSTHLYLLHLNGIFYEFRFDPIKGGDCEIMVATTWFSPRADFHIQVCLFELFLPTLTD
ncbi:WD domain, G-beta repeat-containing protein [Cardiosporidium cionae]|uniref:WD domain, G-beta repeat-containing protein n=1 Tax=Cardiosporidium cionae TaxID=476202 RepID=A0ABQ7J410_9APIC|nr:WD domain, G-beta repeat-containing protein [Cardiosporidium cionae]|eukprot:KAF8817852.1 WD domain, G-beta repeat-containing protein [Cardiosporidium cionae]